MIMKKLILFEILLLVLLFCCKNELTQSPLVLDKSIELKYKELITNTDYQISIVLDSVLNDSRCPKGAECIWAGNAAVRFVYTSPKNTVSFVLNTLYSFRTDSLIDGYRIKMTKLTPYPELGVNIKQGDYKAEIEISKE